MAKVSVIVPVYKVEKYLDKCVKSILNQTYFDLEIILVDDGSPDNCGAMCDGYAEKDFRVRVVHKENGGLSDARNAGIKVATGKYLLFVDSDDWIDATLVEKTVLSAEKWNADIVLFDHMTVEEYTGNTMVFSQSFLENISISSEKEPRLVCRACSAWNKLFNKEFWESSGLSFPVGKHYEDLGTMPKMMAIAKKVVYIKEALYFYLQREGSIMHGTDFKRNYDDRTAMLDGVLTFYKEKGLFNRYEKELEWLVFENGYFVPSKEIVLSDRKSHYLKKFRTYAEERFPRMHENPYIQEMSKKDKILYGLLKNKLYGMMIVLSKGRQFLKEIKNKSME